jgi:hypothetical protein
MQDRDVARIGLDVCEAQCGAHKFDSVLEVAPHVFQHGAGVVDLSEHRDVADGVEHLPTAAQELVGVVRAAKMQQRSVVVEPDAGDVVEAGAAQPPTGGELVVEIDSLRPPPEGQRGEAADAEDRLTDAPRGYVLLMRRGKSRRSAMRARSTARPVRTCSCWPSQPRICSRWP